jgi:hypothetical protein
MPKAARETKKRTNTCTVNKQNKGFLSRARKRAKSTKHAINTTQTHNTKKKNEEDYRQTGAEMTCKSTHHTHTHTHLRIYNAAIGFQNRNKKKLKAKMKKRMSTGSISDIKEKISVPITK